MTIYINGRFLTQKITGVQRYAIEVVKELDKMNLSDEIIILHPNNIIQNLELKNIKLKKIGKLSGQAWEQISLPIYLKKHKAKVLLSMCNLAPIMFPGYVVIHDIAFKTQSKHLDWKFVLWYKIVTRLNIKRYKHIFTVSEFSKKEIMDEYNVNTNSITVTYNSAEHITKVKEDETILKKLNLKSKEFNFSLGSRSYHKNTAYVINLAKNNKDEIFVISGMKNKIFNEVEEEKLENVIYTGYISDNELVCLYKNCKSFIFPSLYEGFGIPPLEAIELGCENVILSSIPVFKEIYGKSVIYVDTSNKMIDISKIDECYEKRNTVIEELLNKYLWNNIAEKIVIELGGKNAN